MQRLPATASLRRRMPSGTTERTLHLRGISIAPSERTLAFVLIVFCFNVLFYSYRIRYSGLLASRFLSSLDGLPDSSMSPSFESITTVLEVSAMVPLLIFSFFTISYVLYDFQIFGFRKQNNYSKARFKISIGSHFEVTLKCFLKIQAFRKKT